MRQQKYICEGERKIIRIIVNNAFNLLQSRTTVPLFRWSGKKTEEIVTKKTNITMWLHAVFEIEDKDPSTLVRIRDDNKNINLTILSQFKLSGEGKRIPGLKEWWNKQINAQYIDVPKIGPHSLRENGWFVNTKQFQGTEEGLENALVETGESVLTTLCLALDMAGFELIREKL